MSHIPSSAMPHAHAQGDTIDDRPAQVAGTRPRPEPTTATPDQKGMSDGTSTAPAPLATSATQRAQGEAPLSSAAPGTATGNRAGSDADATARAAGEPDATARKSGQSSVQGDGEERPSQGRSRLGIAALALGGLALVGGVVAALYPREVESGRKGKKGKRKKG